MDALREHIKYRYKGIKNNHRFQNKGLCKEWEDFENFYSWMLDQGYEYDNPEHTYYLRRRDLNKCFSPSNCFLAKKSKRKVILNVLNAQQKQEILNKYLTHQYTTRELAKIYGVCQGTINKALKEYKDLINDSKKTVKVSDIPGEKWKYIKGLEGKYAVSTFGRVKSFNYRGKGFEGLIKQGCNNGYMVVNLGDGKFNKVHQLVAKAFLPNPNNYKIVNHKNEDRSDNRLENLEWCSPEYNTQFSTADHIIAIDLDTGEQKKYISIQSTKEDGFSPTLVCKVLHGDRYSHKNHHFIYDEERKEFDRREKANIDLTFPKAIKLKGSNAVYFLVSKQKNPSNVEYRHYYFQYGVDKKSALKKVSFWLNDKSKHNIEFEWFTL